MSAEQEIRIGNLTEALVQLQDEVRKDPADAKKRVFLFQLLCVLGEWKRALVQLSVAGQLDAGTIPMVQTYREALRCEVFRADVFTGRRLPLVFGKPAEWVALLIEALRCDSEGRPDEARKFRDRAFETARAVPGRVGNMEFSWIADADTRLGPVLEAVIEGRYYWVPFETIGRIVIEKPEDLRDVVWMPAHMFWTNGGDSVALLPTRYPGSEVSGDPAIRMGRRTEWIERISGLSTGVGQRMLATDVSEYALMDVREIVLDHPEAETTGSGALGSPNG
jgi:type VI secretion system protein ImpE